MMNLRKQKGITLIALVITIIVLLILAGVAISTLSGDNGVLTKATNAKEQYQIAQEKEQITIAVAEAKVQSLGGEILAQDVYDSLKGNLNEEDDLIVIKMASFLFEIGMPSGRNYYYNNGKVTLYTPSTFSVEALSSSEPLPIMTDFNFNLRTEYDKNTSRIYYDIDGTKQQLEDFIMMRIYTSALISFMDMGIDDNTDSSSFFLGLEGTSITVGELKKQYFPGREAVTETQQIAMLMYILGFPSETFNPFLPKGDEIRENKESLFNFYKTIEFSTEGVDWYPHTIDQFGILPYMHGVEHVFKLVCKLDGTPVELFWPQNNLDPRFFVNVTNHGTYVFEVTNNFPSIFKISITSSPVEVLAP